jgi:hypothetical protein
MRFVINKKNNLFDLGHCDLLFLLSSNLNDMFILTFDKTKRTTTLTSSKMVPSNRCNDMQWYGLAWWFQSLWRNLLYVYGIHA